MPNTSQLYRCTKCGCVDELPLDCASCGGKMKETSEWTMVTSIKSGISLSGFHSMNIKEGMLVNHNGIVTLMVREAK